MSYAPTLAWIRNEKAHAIFWARELPHRGEIIYLDLETAGLNPQIDNIVQIGVVSEKGDTLLRAEIDPEQPVNKEATKKHGRTWEGQKAINALTFDQIYPELEALIRGKIVVIYNAPYDSMLLQWVCQRYRLPAMKPRFWEDALRPAAQYIGLWNTQRRWFAYQSLYEAAMRIVNVGVFNNHDAVADCLMTYQIVEAMANTEIEE